MKIKGVTKLSSEQIQLINAFFALLLFVSAVVSIVLNRPSRELTALVLEEKREDAKIKQEVKGFEKEFGRELKRGRMTAYVLVSATLIPPGGENDTAPKKPTFGLFLWNMSDSPLQFSDVRLIKYVVKETSDGKTHYFIDGDPVGEGDWRYKENSPVKFPVLASKDPASAQYLYHFPSVIKKPELINANAVLLTTPEGKEFFPIWPDAIERMERLVENYENEFGRY